MTSRPRGRFRRWLDRPLWGFKRPQVLRSLPVLAIAATLLTWRALGVAPVPRIDGSALEHAVDALETHFEGPKVRVMPDPLLGWPGDTRIPAPQFHLVEAATDARPALRGRLVCGRRREWAKGSRPVLAYTEPERGEPRDCALVLNTAISRRHVLMGAGATFEGDIRRVRLILTSSRDKGMSAAWRAWSNTRAKFVAPGSAERRVVAVLHARPAHLMNVRFMLGYRSMALGGAAKRRAEHDEDLNAEALPKEWELAIKRGVPARLSVGWPEDTPGKGPLIGACASKQRLVAPSDAQLAGPGDLPDGCWVLADAAIVRATTRCRAGAACPPVEDPALTADHAPGVHRFDGPAQSLLLTLFARASARGSHPPLPQTPEMSALRAGIIDDYAVIMGWTEAGARAKDRGAVAVALGRQPHLWSFHRDRGIWAVQVRGKLMQDLSDLGL